MDITPTPPGWLEAVLDDFPTFLKDHASAEKKASGMALNIASHYPDRPALLRAMTDLAVEELTHYREVVRLLIERGLEPGPDERDPYVRELQQLIRRGPEHYLLDRLLIAAVVERRGCERFGLVADALADSSARTAQNSAPLATFYQAIRSSEARHWTLFVELAEQHCETQAVAPRLEELVREECRIMAAQPFRATLH